MNNNDKRIPLEKGSEIRAKNQIYIVCSVINRGGSAITYDAKVKENESRHYVIKEFYPICGDSNLEITRGTDGSLKFNLPQQEKDSLIEEFFKESEILNNCLPDSNSIDGEYFLYLEAVARVNNTGYIVIDTTNCKTLRQKLEANQDFANDLQQLIGIFCDICSALKVIHTNVIVANRILHLDISDKNIVVANDGTVKLLDFGSAIRITDTNNSEKLKKHSFSFTNEFSPIEIKAAAQGAYYEKIGVESDLYSVCSVLFKCVMGRAYEPAIDRENSKEWEWELRSKYKKHGPAVKKLICILKKGLSDFDNRFESASRLYDELRLIQALSIKWQKKIKRVKILLGVAYATLALILAEPYIERAFSPSPVAFLSDNIGSQYFDGDTISFDIIIYDDNGINTNRGYGYENFNIATLASAIHLKGFDATKSFDYDVSERYKLILNISLKDIIITDNGQKTIYIDGIYKGQYAQTHEPIEVVFNGFSKEPHITISNPSYTKVNAEENYSVYYDITFNLPENAEEYDVNFDTVLCHGFTSQKITSQKVEDNVHRLIFEGIQGNPGECKITLKEGTCKLENGALSKKVASPIFEIVDEYVPNYPISIDLSVVSQDFKNHGFVVLSHKGDLNQEYISLIDRSYIHCLGFSADVNVQGDYIILNNLDIDEYTEQKLLIDSGAYISKENGSVSESQIYRLPILQYADRAKPVISIISMAKNPISPGENVTCLIRGNDNSGTFTTKNITSDFIEISGFTANMMIDIQSNDILVTFNNIRPTQDGNSPKITLSQGIYEDSSGNLSSSISFPPFKFVS